MKLGPHLAFSDILNVTLHYHHHGLPVRIGWTPISNIQYIPNLIDALNNDNTDIVMLSLWAHFTLTNLEFYRRRWEAIKKSILRLKARKPGTIFIIKSANTREFQYPDESNWYAWELDKLMRKIMQGVDDVTIIDVWDMTIGHHTGYDIHPHRSVVLEEIKMLLSFICPDDLGEPQ